MAGGIPGGGPGGTLNEINVTPLVDVMLVLLVVFMVTTPIIVEEMQPRKVEVNLPVTDSAPLQADDIEEMLLVLHPNLRITLGGTDDSGSAIELANCTGQAQYGECLVPLEEKLRANPKIQEKPKAQRRIFIAADRALPYGFVVDVMSRIKNAGIPHLGMVTNPPGEISQGG
jgi:biopolymer transport protein TolR